MLGSLVIIYPTPHEGGELVLRHKDREWKFDARSLTAFQLSPSFAYVAFYSDIEHEVLKVTSGRRVTITYNLYLVNPTSKPGTSVIAPDPNSISNLQNTLQGFLKSPEFLPSGGTLGFGLTHLYPVTSEMKLKETASRLKGEDAHVYQACRQLRLQPLLRMIYEDHQSKYSRSKQYGIMLDRIVKNPDYDYEESSYEGALVEDMGGVPVNRVEGAAIENSYWVAERGIRGEFITWVSRLNERNKLEDFQTTYGNEYETRYTYCRPCIIVRIPAAIDRV
jgi:hypothetical protein